MKSNRKHIYVPCEGIDKMLLQMYEGSNDKVFKMKIWTLAGAIARLGQQTIMDKQGKPIRMFFIPETWFNWLKEQFEMPF